MESLSALVSAIFQVLIFSLIPFVWWLITARKQENFFKWLGLKNTIITNEKKYIRSIILTILAFLVISLVTPMFLQDAELATSKFNGVGLSALVPAIIYAFIQTGLSEEILFRGFLLKRISNKFGFQVGNFAQSLIFGLLHGILIVSMIGVLRAAVIIILTGAIGWIMGWINEKQSGGSIISSWIIHGCANIIASLVAMFSIF